MKTIHIFDMDDTLFITPKFADFVGDKNGVVEDDKYFTKYFKKIKSAFFDKMNKDVYFFKQGDFIVPINKSTGKPFSGEFIDYFNNEKKLARMFDIHHNILVLKSFPGFHSTPSTLGKILNSEVIHDYLGAPKKMIITGRDEELRQNIIDIFKEIELPLPNYGLYLFKNGPQSIKDFKTATILKSIQEEQWDEVHFYEDRADWLYQAEEAVNQAYPNVKFIPHLITNIKEQMKLN